MCRHKLLAQEAKLQLVVAGSSNCNRCTAPWVAYTYVSSVYICNTAKHPATSYFFALEKTSIFWTGELVQCQHRLLICCCWTGRCSGWSVCEQALQRVQNSKVHRREICKRSFCRKIILCLLHNIPACVFNIGLL